MSGEVKEVLFSKKNTDYVRGIAAIMVVLSHYAEWWSWFGVSEGNVEVFRVAMTKIGDYGVAVFLLFSGYAMVKSLNGAEMTLAFVGKRIINIYLPYLLVVGIIELMSGGFTSLQDFLQYASGYDHWYMFILFAFYIAFFIIWKIGKFPVFKIVLLSLFGYAFSYFLYTRGLRDFWYSANFAFVLGAFFGEYEKTIKKFVDNTAAIMLILLTVGVFFTIRSGVWPEGNVQTDDMQIWVKIGAMAMWTLWVAVITSKIKFYDPILPIVGRCSLYIYLTHTFLFMWVINHFKYTMPVRFLLATGIILIVSFLLQFIITKGTKGIQYWLKRIVMSTKSVA